IHEICHITLDNGIEGWGETMPNYTWAKVPDKIKSRVVGKPAAELMWEDTLGAGVQMALFAAVSKAQGVPIYSLLGTKIRDWCPISWWNMDMPPKDWAEECRQAVKAGYTSAKLKARPWYDLHAAIQAVKKVVPPGFHIDLDYNSTLANSANAIPHLRELEAYPEVAMIETPIPQSDVAGNKQIRNLIARPLAMHYNNPPIETTLREDVADGFVVCAGASRILKQAAVCEQWNKPFWLQLVGSGITTAWAAHLGAVLPQAKWPAITCMNIWKDQLIKPKRDIRGGFYRVTETPGLGVEIDPKALAKYAVDYTWVDPPRHLYRYTRKSGECTFYACSKQDLHHVYPRDVQPISEPGSSLDIIEDDGTKTFDKLYEESLVSSVRRLK
ncbi:MAG: mandelate racemase/muconate lactonizing enzyme family protein, partial [Candidatus Latescibacteria bacterium]|nr:mandelate racemase/muconate lactonizing enzyme family protein [Candidatus Latescibacterota bacterium]